MQSTSLLQFVGILLTTSIPAVSLANSYKLVDLGPHRFPLAINADGRIAGYRGVRFGVSQPLTWHDGRWHVLDAQPGGGATAIDEDDTVGGTDGTGPVTWTKDGQRRELTLPGDNVGGELRGMSAGMAVGRFWLAGAGDPHCFIGSSHGGAMMDMGLYPGGTRCEAEAINASGEVTGVVSINESGTLHAFAWQQGRFTDLGVLPGRSSSLAAGINVHGHIVGWSGSRAFLWKDGAMTDIGASGELYRVEAWGINSSDEIVGVGVSNNTGMDRPHAVRFEGGVAIELETEVSDVHGWKLQYAYDVNDSGVIVGSGWKGGGHRGFMLVPVGGRK